MPNHSDVRFAKGQLFHNKDITDATDSIQTQRSLATLYGTDSLAMHQQPADGTFWPRLEKDEATPSAPVRRLGLQQAGQQEASTALARQHAAGGPWLCFPIGE